MTSYIFDENSIKHIQSIFKDLNSPDRLSMKHEFFVNSAVVFLIVQHEDRPYDVVLIRRTKRDDDKHSGEMGFPGGKFDDQLDKTYQDTALRELEEELGISKLDVKILGCLDDHLTPKGFIITPFVGYINESQEMIKQDDEIKEIVTIPITFFVNKNNYRERTYTLRGDLIGVGKFNYKAPHGKKYVIFGATSHIIVHFVDNVYNAGLMTPRCRRIKCEDIKERIIK